MKKATLPARQLRLIKEIKERVQNAQLRAAVALNAELVRLYWDIGQLIDGRQQEEGWGTAVIPRLAEALQNELAEVKGFSERNISRMIAFYRAYPDPGAFLPQAVAKLALLPKLPQAVAKIKTPAKKKTRASATTPPLTVSILWSIPWGHHALLMEKVEFQHRLWYMRQTLAEGWSRNILFAMIQSEAHRRQGKTVANFDRLLPAAQSDLVRQSLKDPYVFDFLTLQEPFHERELESNLLRQLERFLIELGQGFAFVGRQVHLEVEQNDFYIDLLFYHLKLRCYVVIDLKKGEFKPEYAGKMNFYLNVIDDQLRHAADEPAIGLILCQDRNHIIAEYALRGVNRPIGVSEYELTRALPTSLQSALPTVAEIEAELTDADPKTTDNRKPKPKSPRQPKKKIRNKPNRR